LLPILLWLRGEKWPLVGMFENLDLSVVFSCAATRWSPRIGDPSIAGWMTVGAYLMCAGLAMIVSWTGPRGRMRTFWVLVCATMLLLAVNKQLDLQSALTALGRCVSQLQGWYADRRSFQRGFIEGLLGVAVVLLALGLYLMRKHLRQNGFALLGLAIVGCFVAVRAVGFHHFDAFLRQDLFDLRANLVLELSGLVLIAINAIALLVSRAAPQIRI
jgi:LrgB-like family